MQSWNRFILHQVHVELLETKKRKEELQINKKPFVYKETDFPAIVNNERKKSPTFNSGKSIIHRNCNWCLMEYVLTVSEVSSKIQDEKGEEESEITQLFGTKQLQMNCCLKCGEEVSEGLLRCNIFDIPEIDNFIPFSHLKFTYLNDKV